MLQALDLPPVAIPNGLAFSPDGRRIYWCDSRQAQVRTGDYDPDTGRIGQARVFAELPEGEPDGATVDAHGHYWCALWGQGQVLGFTPEGQVMAQVRLPASQPSCVAFGGPDLQTLYITSARVGLDAEQLEREPTAGALHAVDLPWAGLPEPVYGGAR